MSIRAQYIRTHQAVVADLAQEIRDAEHALRYNSRRAPAWVVVSIRNSIPLMRERARDYEIENELTLRTNNVATMELFIDNVRERERFGANPEFSFLFPEPDAQPINIAQAAVPAAQPAVPAAQPAVPPGSDRVGSPPRE
jgi:hypothetical protein